MTERDYYLKSNGERCDVLKKELQQMCLNEDKSFNKEGYLKVLQILGYRHNMNVLEKSFNGDNFILGTYLQNMNLIKEREFRIDRIISIETMKNEKYAISFRDNKIESFNIIPNDYSIEEFMDLLVKTSDNHTQYLFDINSYGIFVDNYLENKRIYNIDVPESKDIEPNILQYSKDRIIDFALNSQITDIEKIEFKKLINELNNLKIKVTESKKISIVKIDDDMTSSRARCYIQYCNKLLKKERKIV